MDPRTTRQFRRIAVICFAVSGTGLLAAQLLFLLEVADIASLVASVALVVLFLGFLALATDRPSGMRGSDNSTGVSTAMSDITQFHS